MGDFEHNILLLKGYWNGGDKSRKTLLGMPKVKDMLTQQLAALDTELVKHAETANVKKIDEKTFQYMTEHPEVYFGNSPLKHMIIPNLKEIGEYRSIIKNFLEYDKK